MALKFNVESKKFAMTLQHEHQALGDLLADIEITSVAQDVLSGALIKAARKAHDEVRFQRARVEAAMGKKSA